MSFSEAGKRLIRMGEMARNIAHRLGFHAAAQWLRERGVELRDALLMLFPKAA